MDYNVNITIFGDHCTDLGIDKSLIIDYTIFDDHDVGFEVKDHSQVARLTTCLFEYIEHYNSYRMSQLPSVKSNPSEDKQMLDISHEATKVYSGTKSDVSQPLPETSDVREVLLPTEQPEDEGKCCCCCYM